MDAIQWFKIKFLGRGSYGTVHLPKSRNRYGSSWLMAVKFAAIERSFSLMKEAFFFFFVRNILYNRTEPYNLSRREKNRRWCKTTTRGRRGEERGKDGNAARVNSCRGPRCHMMGAEVRTSVNLLGLPLGRGRKKS
jgi:hypothetical protein